MSRTVRVAYEHTFAYLGVTFRAIDDAIAPSDGTTFQLRAHVGLGELPPLTTLTVAG